MDGCPAAVLARPLASSPPARPSPLQGLCGSPPRCRLQHGLACLGAALPLLSEPRRGGLAGQAVGGERSGQVWQGAVRQIGRWGGGQPQEAVQPRGWEGERAAATLPARTPDLQAASPEGCQGCDHSRLASSRRPGEPCLGAGGVPPLVPGSGSLPWLLRCLGCFAGLLPWLLRWLAGLLACWLPGLLACWLAGLLACRLAQPT